MQQEEPSCGEVDGGVDGARLGRAPRKCVGGEGFDDTTSNREDGKSILHAGAAKVSTVV